MITMALKTCEDCKNEVSTLATICPYCGRPNANSGIVTIEQTQKRFKRWDFFAFLLAVPGFIYFLFYLAVFNGSPDNRPLYILLMFGALAMVTIGVVIAIAAGVGRWWHHG
jgi:predicted amidophosphoribosyltransferase